MTPVQRLFKRALEEKQAFIPMGKNAEGMAAGPGGAPVTPGPLPPAGPPGAPMDPAAAGGAPMDPAAMGGAPPMDPAMAGMPPMDPAAGGAPPMDPSMGGMPPMDPSMMGMPPMEPPPSEAPPIEAGLTSGDADVVDKITQRTMDIVRQTMEMVGKAKTKEEKQKAMDIAGDKSTPPEETPGPVSGMTGFDPAEFQGAYKTASILSRAFPAKR